MADDKKFKEIVFVDDDDATNFFHKIIMDKVNICDAFRFYTKAKDALVYFDGLEAENIPDILFLDINMPDMDGWDFLRDFQKLDLSHAPRIIMLTTSASPMDLEKAASFEIVDRIMHKSLSADDLISLRDELLN